MAWTGDSSRNVNWTLVELGFDKKLLLAGLRAKNCIRKYALYVVGLHRYVNKRTMLDGGEADEERRHSVSTCRFD